MATVSAGDDGPRVVASERDRGGDEHGGSERGSRECVATPRRIGDEAGTQEVAERVLTRCGHTPLVLLAREGR